jgi:ATP-dependent Clp protease ATP-binding subunit ClpC
MSGFLDFIKKPSSNATQNPAPTQSADPVTPTQSPHLESAQMLQEAHTQTSGAQPTDPKQSIAAAFQEVETHPPITSPPQHDPSISSGPATPQATQDKKQGNLDVMTHLTQRSNRVFLTANTKAKELKNNYVDSEHILHGLLADGEIYKLLVDLKVQPQVVEDELTKVYRHENNTAAPQPSPRVKKIIDDSLVIARKLGFEFISPEHLLLALYEEGEGVGARTLVKLGLKKEDMNKKVAGKKEGLEEDQKEAAKKKSVLQQYTIDLTAKAAQGQLDQVVERSEVIERVIHILSRRGKNNPALVGEAGVGKTAIVEGLAERIVGKQVPEPLLNKKILQLDLMSVLAGASHRGDFEERMKDLIEEVKSSQGQIILFIDEIHNIVGAGSTGEGSLDASNFLKPALARGEIQLIGATTLTEYRKYVEKDPALERRFQPVLVPEPTEEQAIKMLKSIKDKYEAFHKVKIPDAAIDAAVRYSKRYIGDRFLPDKAVDLIDEAASAVRLPLISLPEEIKSLEDRIAQLKQETAESEKAGDKVKARINRSKIDDINAGLNEKKEQYNLKKAQTTTEVTEAIIKDIVARWTGIPVTKITSSEKDKLSNLESIMHERLIGQETAVSAVAAAVRRGRAGLKSTQRPIGSFVFLGPTGVGKTELAKTLADILFGQEEAMVRFDMTEYMEKHEVAKLLGAPPGYVGYEEGGKLTEAVRRRPYSVVLFDEVEKAHPDIFNILLQILDDGRLTDNKGHTVSFKNTVVICTSNIGTQIIQDEILKQVKPKEEKQDEVKTEPVVVDMDKKKYDEIKQKVMQELNKFFRPELINRFDEVIIFEPLKLEEMLKIVKLQLKALGKLLEDQNIGFSFSDDAAKEIARAGFDPIFGARPLKRAIQKLIENPVSTLIIETKVKPGDTVHVEIDGENFVFNVEQVEMVPAGSTATHTKKSFVCANCAQTFETELMATATPICTHCASKNVHEVPPVVEQPPKTEEKNIPVENSQSASV